MAITHVNSNRNGSKHELHETKKSGCANKPRKFLAYELRNEKETKIKKKAKLGKTVTLFRVYLKLKKVTI